MGRASPRRHRKRHHGKRGRTHRRECQTRRASIAAPSCRLQSQDRSRARLSGSRRLRADQRSLQHRPSRDRLCAWLSRLPVRRRRLAQRTLQTGGVAQGVCRTRFSQSGGVGRRYELSGKGDRTLVLVHEMGGSLESWDDVAPRLAETRRVLRYDTRGAGMSQKVRGELGIDTMAGDIRRFERFRARWLGNDPASYATIYRMLAGTDMQGELTRLRCPVLVIGGSLDRVRPPPLAEAVANAIPGARYVEVRTGHYMAVQTPNLISDCIDEFLRTVGA